MHFSDLEKEHPTLSGKKKERTEADLKKRTDGET